MQLGWVGITLPAPWISLLASLRIFLIFLGPWTALFQWVPNWPAAALCLPRLKPVRNDGDLSPQPSQLNDILPKLALAEFWLFLSASLHAQSMIHGDGKSPSGAQLSHHRGCRGEMQLPRDFGVFIVPSPDGSRQESNWEGLCQASPSQWNSGVIKSSFTARETSLGAAQRIRFPDGLRRWQLIEFISFWVCYQQGEGNVLILQFNRIPIRLLSAPLKQGNNWAFFPWNPFCVWWEINCAGCRAWFKGELELNLAEPLDVFQGALSLLPLASQPAGVQQLQGSSEDSLGATAVSWFHGASNLKAERTFELRKWNKGKLDTEWGANPAGVTPVNPMEQGLWDVLSKLNFLPDPPEYWGKKTENPLTSR